MTGYYFTNSSTTYSSGNNFNPANLITNRIDPVIDFVWGGTNRSPNLSNGLYSVRWVGQVQPQYSETYFFDVRSDDGCRLWVNDQLLIDKWVGQGATDWTNALALQGGTRYNIRLEYLQTGGSAQAHLYWYGADQSKQIIPNTCLYPTNILNSNSIAPAAITSALSAIGFLGQPFSFNVTGANTPLGFTATNLPPGLAFNPANGLISGTPTLAGDFQVMLTASNAVGTGASVLDILIINTGSSVVQEIWTNIPGTNVADIPIGTPANSTNVPGALEGLTDFGDNYGERVRGYFTAPVSGNYYFWIAGSDSAQLWISDDGESVNKVLRSWVMPTNNPTAPGQNGTSSRQWSLQPSQKSGWLALAAGQKYYLEVLHKAGAGAGDNWSVAWLQDPTGTNTTPAGVVPGYLISRYYPPLPVNVVGSLYAANILALPGINSTAVGLASLRVSADNSQAILSYSVNGIASSHVDHIYSDPYTSPITQTVIPKTLLFDIAAAHPQADGSYIWKIKATGALSAGDIVSIINSNKCTIVIQTPANPDGEIGGHFTLANGTQNFIAPPAPPAWADDSANANAAAHPQADGSYVWNIKATGPLATNDIIEIINENKAYLTVQTPANPAGEISGHFTIA
ncbi:MAG TPA: PA14 domain-containing protein, partial [Verrucomicrobiae bacterium]